MIVYYLHLPYVYNVWILWIMGISNKQLPMKINLKHAKWRYGRMIFLSKGSFPGSMSHENLRHPPATSIEQSVLETLVIEAIYIYYICI